MGAVELRREGDLAYREAMPMGEPDGATVVLVHGYPESSLMWESLMGRLAAAGRRCVAPDLYNLGDSAETRPASFHGALEDFNAFMDRLALGDVVVVVHDWGGFIGLAWACDHPDQVAALVISDTGFFSNARWHGLGETIRGPEGDALLAGIDRDGFAGLLNGSGSVFSPELLDAYWRPFEEGRGRRATLDFYRSLDFSMLSPWDGKLAQLDVPSLILWGEDDPFATLAAARRFDRELPDTRMAIVEGAGHFVWDEAPARCADEVERFLAQLAA